MQKIRQDLKEQQRKLDEQHRAQVRELEEESRKMKKQNELNKIQDDESPRAPAKN